MGEPYDLNFCLPVRELENERVKLTPFIPAIRAEPYFLGTRDYPNFYDGLVYGPFQTADEFVDTVITKAIEPDAGRVGYAVLDKTKPAADLRTEIGYVFILPAFHRTHVTSNAVGLLMQYCLDLPKDGGLGMRRVQWQCTVWNTASRKTAERLGFKFESVERWQRVYRGGKMGDKGHEG
ncbi:hypothetical protein K474DRAFT_1680071 [Panus rudis PR-1116 ss-1]|nr:hypothetical protein K474DRAFT_1680071 [Panus rudis PR-1116 ss-1]